MKKSTYNIVHKTCYKYFSKIEYSINALHLTPKTSKLQYVHEWQVDAPGEIINSIDGFGNICQHFTLYYPIKEINIVASGIVTSFDNYILPMDIHEIDTSFYLQHTKICIPNKAIKDFATSISNKYYNQYDKAMALMQAIHTHMQYIPNITDTSTLAIEAFERKVGVCQDYAHVFLACARSIGIPARYVSGYFFSENAELASHAWIDVATSDESWISLDVTHNIPTNDKYIRLAVGVDYKSVAPIKGIQIGGDRESMEVEVKITPCEIFDIAVG
jgi:transglutaminase-like putative cysteine protease